MTIPHEPSRDGELLVREDGPQDAPALLLIHGTAASALTWDLMVPLLTDAHRVIRLDLLGCGSSGKPLDGDYTIHAQARRAGEVLDRLGVGHATIVGHSSGGIVATALTERRPDLVAALALINTGPGMAAYLAPESGAVQFDPARWPPTEEQIRLLASSGFGRGDFAMPQESIDQLRATPFPVFAATWQAPQVYLEEQTLPERLKGLGKPLLVIFGEDDRRWRPSSAADYLVVPEARVEMLPGSGHTPILEDPARTAELLLAFTSASPR
ncbi:alpha/beta hydrolase [Nonomuraea sp. NBC_01738]|uniref:alpha/beta fold hydrolase n=1 Tax=Nonomuraea sp. NBC_01738 TaxID=2976003 RepID=UPI002E13A4C2|nr:alpha/beta hydrolase [Nonomuraea sp. NBC_01738]